MAAIAKQAGCLAGDASSATTRLTSLLPSESTAGSEANQRRLRFRCNKCLRLAPRFPTDSAGMG
jgi:hypothetical protein